MLELEVVPEHGLCGDQIEFLLGMHFSQAVAVIQSMVGSIKGVQILYSEKSPLDVDLVINLTSDGIKLIFDPVNQRLKTIEVYSLNLLRLRYNDVLFNCPEVSPTIEQIDQSFGATHPGVYDDEKNVFILTFRGLSFEFPADSKFQPSYDGIRQKLGQLQFPPGASPRVSRLHLYSGQVLSECQAPPPPAPRHPVILQDGLEVLRGNPSRGRGPDKETRGIRVRLQSVPDVENEENGGEAKDILFGATVQDVVTTLGAPARIFYKCEDKMKIHLPNSHRQHANQKSDFFYNYFTLGFDLLFDARTNTVKKFVLHTNFPGHYNFNMYHRCLFELPLYPESSVANQSYTPYTVTAFSKWDDISANLKPSDRPVVLNRASSTNTTNPFGSTFCYGYQDIIFEVMPNGHLASVTLYSLRSGRKSSRVDEDSMDDV